MKLSQIGSVLSWKKAQGLKEDPNVIVNFSCAPMMSLDCEGSLQYLQGSPFKQEKLFHGGPLKMLIQRNWVLLLMENCCIYCTVA